jgi:AraC-like DNA-binding protein
MPLVSSWPLTAGSVRYVIPPFALAALAADPVSRDCHPAALGHYVHAAGHSMQRSPAEHEDHLLIFCVQGRGWLEAGDAETAIGPGDALLLPAGAGHAYRADSDQPWSLYWVHFRAAHGLREALHAGRGHAMLHPGLAPDVLAEWRALLEARSPGFEPEAMQVLAARLRLLLVLLRRAGSAARQRGSRLDVAAVQAWMQAHLHEAVTLEQLAAVAGMEKFHFAKTFRRLVGQPPLQHFLHRRMARACEWLDAGEDSISVIAARLGYSDPPYFSRQFRQVTGMAPGAYRALKRG